LASSGTRGSANGLRERHEKEEAAVVGSLRLDEEVEA